MASKIDLCFLVISPDVAVAVACLIKIYNQADPPHGADLLLTTLVFAVEKQRPPGHNKLRLNFDMRVYRATKRRFWTALETDAGEITSI